VTGGARAPANRAAGNTDYTSPQTAAGMRVLKEPASKMSAWFAQNVAAHAYPKLFALPIGHYNGHAKALQQLFPHSLEGVTQSWARKLRTPSRDFVPDHRAVVYFVRPRLRCS
jgi:hypothetical protein